MAERIAWQEGKFSQTGYVGSLPLFSVGYGSRRQERMWYVETQLPVSSPGLIGQHYASPEDAKAGAERLFAAFVRKIGAEFKGEE